MAQNEKLSKEIQNIRSQIVVVLDKGKPKKKKDEKTDNKEDEDPKISNNKWDIIYQQYLNRKLNNLKKY